MMTLSSVHQNSYEPALCSICLEDIELHQRMRILHPLLDRGHRFHETCIKPWMEAKRTCPNCRMDLGDLSDVVNKVSFIAAEILRGITPVEEEFLEAAILGNRRQIEMLMGLTEVQPFVKGAALVEASALGHEELVDLLMNLEEILISEKHMAFMAALDGGHSFLLKHFMDHFSLDPVGLELLALEEAKLGKFSRVNKIFSLQKPTLKLRYRAYLLLACSILCSKRDGHLKFTQVLLLTLSAGYICMVFFNSIIIDFDG